MYDAIVLAGGAARRLGGVAKPQLTVAGTSLLDRVVAAVASADRVVVVGPRQPVRGDVRWRREEPPGGGPVAAIAAGLPETSADVVLVLAADLPDVAPAVPVLLTALDGADVALLEGPDGRPNYLAAAWRRSSLAAALAAVGGPEGVAVRRLVEGARVVRVPDPDGWGRDCDTWDDLLDARTREGATDA